MARKEFHLDFGQGNEGFPKTSTIHVEVTGGVGSLVVSGKVKVHWHLPRWFVTKPSPASNEQATTVTGEHDPDKPGGPVGMVTNPDDPDYLEMQSIGMYLQEQQEFIETGAELIGDALKAEEAIAEFYATGPLFELGASGLGAVIGKAGEALEKVGELRAFAAKAIEEAATARRLAQEGKAAGKSAEEVAEAEEVATQLEEKAAEATQKAKQAKQEAEAVQSVRKLDFDISSNGDTYNIYTLHES